MYLFSLALAGAAATLLGAIYTLRRCLFPAIRFPFALLLVSVPLPLGLPFSATSLVAFCGIPVVPSVLLLLLLSLVVLFASLAFLLALSFVLLNICRR